MREHETLRIRTLYEWIQPHFLHPAEGSQAVLESGCVLLADIFKSPLRPVSDDVPTHGGALWAGQRVEEACRFYRKHMLSNPDVETVARAVGVSGSQLRRLFAAVNSRPPAKVFRSMQMDYARRLLAGTRLSVEELAGELGFASLSSFSRAYTRHFGHSPTRNRRSHSSCHSSI